MAKLMNARRLHDYAGHKDCIYRLEPGANSYSFFSGAGEGWIVEWDLREEDSPGKLIAKLPGSIFSLHYIQDSNCVLAGHRVGGMHLLDLNNNKEARNIKLGGTVFDMKAIPEKDLLVIALAGGYIAFHKLSTLDAISCQKYGEDHVRSLAIHPSGEYIAAGFSDNYIRFIDAGSRKTFEAFQAHTNSVFNIRFNSKGNRLISGGRDAFLNIWDIENGAPELFLSIPAHMLTINFLAFSPCGKYVATASRDKTVKIWDQNSWKLLKVIDREKLGGHMHSVNTLLWCEWQNQLITAGDDKTVKVWDINSVVNEA